MKFLTERLIINLAKELSLGGFSVNICCYSSSDYMLKFLLQVSHFLRPAYASISLIEFLPCFLVAGI